nr:SGNH/GDSL hydrolase family protein [Prevotella pallens]
MSHKIYTSFRIGIAFGLFIIVQNLHGVNCEQTNSSTNSLANKNVVFLGDSNLWTGGKDNSNPRSWSFWFCKEFSIKNSMNYARSGATWSHTKNTKRDIFSYEEKLSDNNVVLNQVLRLIKDTKELRCSKPDYIFVMAGTNDAWFQNKRPQLFSESVQDVFTLKNKKHQQALSLARTVKLDCELLQKNFPKSKIILVTPMFTTQASTNLISKVSDVISACGEYLNINVIRLDTMNLINPPQERNKLTYTLDGTHTNPSGAERVGDYIAKKIKEFIQ